MPKTLCGSWDQALRPLPSVAKGVQACRLPGLKPLKPSAAAGTRHSGHCPLLLRAFKPAVCWGCKSASLQTPQRSAAALHSVLLKLLLKTPGCQPSNASTLRSGLTHSIVEAFGRLPAFRRVLSAPALHILSLGVHECSLPAFRPLFKPLNPPQRLYTLSCWGFQTTVC